MKNIHVLKTEKPSRLLKDLVDGTYQFKKEVLYGNRFELPLSIYITSDGEIKEMDWFYNTERPNCPINRRFINTVIGENCKKIVLTNNITLIENGVQAIDDEFLEWFVENPSCEFVEVEKMFNVVQFTSREFIYKIIIPKEEPKQETLEEFIQRQLSLDKYQDQESAIKYSILAGAKWQQEQDKNKYSEEDLKQFAFECVANFLSNRENKVEIELVNVISDRNNEQFEKFKNK